jgi:hypothetical protein
LIIADIGYCETNKDFLQKMKSIIFLFLACFISVALGYGWAYAELYDDQNCHNTLVSKAYFITGASGCTLTTDGHGNPVSNMLWNLLTHGYTSIQNVVIRCYTSTATHLIVAQIVQYRKLSLCVLV